MPDMVPDNVAIEAWLEAKVGASAWTGFHESTRTEIVTAVTCYKSFEELSDPIDYASSILPIMKALEHELRSQFYDPYVSYLKDHYSPEEYSEAIMPEGYKDDYKSAAKIKNKVLGYNGGPFFVDPATEEFFTLGEFIHTVSTSDRGGDRKDRHIDRPVLNYCQEVLFAGKGISNNTVRKWLGQLLTEKEVQRRPRNNSAHGGLIQSKKDAEKAISEVVTVGKLLAKIIRPDFMS